MSVPADGRGQRLPPGNPGWTRRPGVALLGRAAPGRVTRWAREAERAGFASFWVTEDYFQPGAFALAAAAAAVTERIVVGLGVMNPYVRHPAVLAMEVAALAGVAPRRIVLGLGSSNRRWIEQQMGLPFDTPLATLHACVTVVRRLLGGETVTHEGQGFTLRDVRLALVPEEPVPIFLGVKGPRALRMAAEIADGVHGSILSSPAHVQRLRATTDAARRARGAPRGGGPREPAPTGSLPLIAYVPASIEDDGDAARAAVRPLVARYVAALHGQSILADAGVPPDLSLAIRDRVLAGESAVDLVSPDLVRTLAVAGTPAECREALRPWTEAGLDAPIVVPVARGDAEPSITRLAETILPAWPGGTDREDCP